MKRILLILSLALCASGPVNAGEISTEFDADYSFVGSAGMETANKAAGGMSEQSNMVRYVISSQIENGNLLRIGAQWQRYSFSSMPSTALLPNTLQSLCVVVGADMELWGWIVRIEAQPGYYGDFSAVTGRGFDLPFIIGGTYLMNADLQWVAGVSVDVERGIPVLPAAGVRWKFADQWVLNAVLPRPRLEYEINKSAILYVGGDFKLNSYRMGNNFGTGHGQPVLNSAILDYTEIRVGAGTEIKANASVKIDFEAGAMVYREFDYPRADMSVKTDQAAAYGQIIVNCRF
jgi:hypothetical protein